MKGQRHDIRVEFIAHLSHHVAEGKTKLPLQLNLNCSVILYPCMKEGVKSDYTHESWVNNVLFFHTIETF